MADTEFMLISGKDLVSRINKLVNQKGLKRVDMYEIVPSATLSAWKVGQIPRAYTICDLAEFLGTSTDYLLTGKEPDDLSQNECDLLIAYNRLNEIGKKAALDTVRGLYASFPLPSEQVGVSSKTAI